ncbi:hypothetical protein ACA910_017545 [Epithemia clementina (nom. ined.)]
MDHVLSVHDVSNVYFVPSLLEEQGLHRILQTKLNLPPTKPNLTSWVAMAESVTTATQTVTIALIGKYTGLQDSYLSVIKALRHASMAWHVKLHLEWIEASLLEDTNGASEGIDITNNDGELEEQGQPRTTESCANAWKKLEEADGVVIPGGFGRRGWEGKLKAAYYCRVNDKPCLGICLGFQAMVVEYCRNVLHCEKADSTEFEEQTSEPTIIFMPEIDPTTMGGTMRLGARTTHFTHGLSDLNENGANGNQDGDNDDDKNENRSNIQNMSQCQTLYGGVSSISERHRHRYEVNPEKVEAIHNGGLKFVGRDGNRMEISELPQHTYYVGCQFHPEFQSRPLRPSPPFYGLLRAATNKNTSKENTSSS